MPGFDYEAFLRDNDRPANVKRELPCTYVLEVLAECKLHAHGSRVVVQCPLHEDSSPSMEVWETDRGQKFGCWPCGKSGDVIDLLRDLYGLGFGEALTIGEQAVRALKATGWTGPALLPGVPWEAPRYKALLDRAKDPTPADELCRAKGWGFSGSFLSGRYWVGGLHGEVLIPYYTRDLELVGMKHRRGSGADKPFSFPGSKLIGTFYGEHNLRSSGPILLCEGESDVWTADFALRGLDTGFSVLGLPAGAGSLPFRCDEFKGREFHVCLDGDEAGRSGASRWASALLEGGADVRLWDLPDGQDITSIGGPAWLIT